MTDFFDNYLSKLRFSQIFDISMEKTQEIFDYLVDEVKTEDVDLDSLLDNAREDGYNEGWEDAMHHIESVTSDYPRRNRK